MSESEWASSDRDERESRAAARNCTGIFRLNRAAQDPAGVAPASPRLRATCLRCSATGPSMGSEGVEPPPHRPRRWVLPLHHEPSGLFFHERRLRSSAEATAAVGATSPLVAEEYGLQVPQEPAHAVPDPEGPLRPESDHLLFS